MNVNFERELARIEKRLVAEDPLLAEKLATFEQITAPRPRAERRRHVFLLAALVFALLALTSALAAGTSTDHPRPSQVVTEYPAGTG
ncbi:DUF3040 domain-containing protein [Streptomyces sp. NPDC006393]|uniref:DUF3040 domain-containing protein n=1 Tax=Streptomyces sp. NPDC006393 TaxID=3156763 RepID=UPI0033EE543D